MKLKTYEVEVMHSQVSGATVKVKARSVAGAERKVQLLWDQGEVETKPCDGEFTIIGTEEV